jgi:hypothetical protein
MSYLRTLQIPHESEIMQGWAPEVLLTIKAGNMANTLYSVGMTLNRKKS